eukprot:TRINITY_DN618_c0_g1_i1.p1 TRINITY_DN618_c0_g1~~TRINITY_DN618_c0_g1_i1.p1  ORF type:complete len:382 (-),score=92.10 TRINITY_DN618_c0_g1_i1:43-1188(-)
MLLLLLAGALAQPDRFPGQTWERATPESQGMSSEGLEEAFDFAGRSGDQLTYCTSVHINGYLVAERFWSRPPPGPVYPWIIWSVSKAFTNTLLATGERDGRLNTEEFASKYIQEWNQPDHPARNITIDMLLRHDSGRWYDFVTDFLRSQFQPSQTDFAISLRQQHEPGTHYQYNQMGIQNLERVITQALNISVAELAERELFAPLQFESDSEYQEKSILIPLPNDPILYGGVRTTCQDLARFGHLWLNRGVWNGRRVFNDDWYTKALSNPPAPRAGRSYHWGGYPNVKAQGMGKQFVTFNPEKNLVLTRIGNPIGAGFDVGGYIDRVMASFLDGDKGSYDPAREAAEWELPEEEEQFAEMLRRMGATVKPDGSLDLQNVQL